MPSSGHRKKLEFQISIGQVRHENIVADGDRLQQILMNLLSNAIKYTPEQGRIILRINELYSPSPGKSQYEFICIDSGIGISEEFIPRIFEPFTRQKIPASANCRNRSGHDHYGEYRQNDERFH